RVHPAQLLSSASGVAVHLLRHCHGSFVSQFLELSIQRRPVEPELLAIPQELRVGRGFSLYCVGRKNAVDPRRLFLEGAVDLFSNMHCAVVIPSTCRCLPHLEELREGHGPLHQRAFASCSTMSAWWLCSLAPCAHSGSTCAKEQ